MKSITLNEKELDTIVKKTVRETLLELLNEQSKSFKNLLAIVEHQPNSETLAAMEEANHPELLKSYDSVKSLLSDCED